LKSIVKKSAYTFHGKITKDGYDKELKLACLVEAAAASSKYALSCDLLCEFPPMSFLTFNHHC
jgi:hypothetical protein